MPVLPGPRPRRRGRGPQARPRPEARGRLLPGVFGYPSRGVARDGPSRTDWRPERENTDLPGEGGRVRPSRTPRWTILVDDFSFVAAMIVLLVAAQSGEKPAAVA